jgi:hypothetical protein
VSFYGRADSIDNKNAVIYGVYNAENEKYTFTEHNWAEAINKIRDVY